jgi:flagellar biosynthesis GTPase FlhF
MDDTQIHEFRAPTARAALAEIRQALGADAIILEQSTDGPGIVIKACLELPPPQQAPVPEPEAIVPEVIVREPTFQFAREDVRTLTGVYRFVGSTGVGKTSFIVKIAAEWVLHNAPEQLVLITTDCQGLACNEALHLAADLLGVRLVETRSENLREALSQLSHHALVLIDTQGHSVQHGRVTAIPGKDLLVVSALHQPEYLERQKQCFAKIAGVCVSHMDEALSLGEGFARALDDWQLPIYWTSAGAGPAATLTQATEETFTTSKPAASTDEPTHAIELTV